MIDRMELQKMTPWIRLVGRLFLAYAAAAAIFAFAAIVLITVMRFPRGAFLFSSGIGAGVIATFYLKGFVRPFFDVCGRAFHRSKSLGERVFDLEERVGHFFIGHTH